MSSMFRIALSWDNVPAGLGQQAAIDIAEGFVQRPWHQDVVCTWNESINSLILEAANDFDENGAALMDEFSDEISACVRNAGDGSIRVISINDLH